MNYTITLDPPESESAPMWSAFCEETGLVTESQTPLEAFIGLLEAHKIIAEQEQRTYPARSITFSVPSLAV